MTRSHHDFPIYLGSPGEEISIQDLQTIKNRFKRLNHLRRERAQEFLQPRQRIFLDLLPLIFHGNFSMLPGFVSAATPAGIPDYHPDQQILNLARHFAPSFNYLRTPSHIYPIEGLFLMGSVGSIAFSKSSDMDIWLCHKSDLSQHEINELQQKASNIEEWADALGLEIHFFLINSQQFRLGQNIPISAESSGQTQHYLLLEEFYRTAIYIAGKSPAWWLVPPHEENNYTNYLNHLISKRFIPEHELIDFGGFETVPAEEFIGATLWHLYKALYAPHKSLLKLLLMECYASQYPQPEWLCLDIKKAVYQGEFMKVDLDPYLLIYTKVERYLQNTHDHDRLALARQSFYLKVMGSSDTTLDPSIRTFRENYIQQIAKTWNWPISIIEELKQIRSWNIKKATAEHAVIVQQLTQCYRMIMGFAKNHVTSPQTNNNDLKLIGRKLHSFLERKPGKIEIITTHAEVHSKENALSIVESGPTAKINGWGIFLKYVQTNTATNFAPIHKCRTLVEILCWLIINGLYHKHLLINFSSHSLSMPDSELRSTLRQINAFLSQNFNSDAPLDIYQTSKTPLHSLVLINMGMADSERLCVVSERSDPLSYGVNRQCFIHTVSRIILSSWSDITTTHEEGLEGLFNCLTDIINNQQRPLSLKNVKFVCNMPNRARDITYRVEVVFSILVKLFSTPQQHQSPRYILPGGTSYYVFQSINNTLSYKMLATEKQLLEEVARPQELFSTIYFDQSVLEHTPIHLIYSMNKPQVIQLFCHDNKAGEITIYILDERGSLYTQQHSKSSINHLLKQYAVFLESVISRTLFENFVDIEYYEIEKNADHSFSCVPLQMEAVSANPELSLRITGEDTDQGIIYTIYCNEKEFSSLEHGTKVFFAAYQHILQFRNGKNNYPIHITDIDLPLSAFRIKNPAQLQTIHYIKYKQKIEERFNV